MKFKYTSIKGIFKQQKLILIGHKKAKIHSREVTENYEEKMLFFSHLHEIVEGLYFHCRLCVCVSVCPVLLVNKFKPN